MLVESWTIKEQTGYEPISTFYEDFSIADAFGKDAIKDTYNKSFELAKEMGYKYMTELVMALNWRMWRWYGANKDYSILYLDLYEKTCIYVRKNFTKEELSYYYRTTD